MHAGPQEAAANLAAPSRKMQPSRFNFFLHQIYKVKWNQLYHNDAVTNERQHEFMIMELQYQIRFE
jgi:hypothetical protein